VSADGGDGIVSGGPQTLPHHDYNKDGVASKNKDALLYVNVTRDQAGMHGIAKSQLFAIISARLHVSLPNSLVASVECTGQDAHAERRL
jgi:hypothetical protein